MKFSTWKQLKIFDIILLMVSTLLSRSFTIFRGNKVVNLHGSERRTTIGQSCSGSWHDSDGAQRFYENQNQHEDWELRYGCELAMKCEMRMNDICVYLRNSLKEVFVLRYQMNPFDKSKELYGVWKMTELQAETNFRQETSNWRHAPVLYKTKFESIP